jgi:hypothetical protein
MLEQRGGELGGKSMHGNNEAHVRIMSDPPMLVRPAGSSIDVAVMNAGFRDCLESLSTRYETPRPAVRDTTPEADHRDVLVFHKKVRFTAIRRARET